MKKLTVNLKDRNYDIIIQKGLLDNIKSYLDFKGKNFIISNEKVFGLYGKYFNDFEVILIPDGEKYKNLETYTSIMDKLLSLSIQRTDTIIALGGGVVGDVAGFVASTILRGIRLVQIPTTLLAQVDSSVGGKTGIDTKYGKNLIGTFYQPNLVLIDPNALDTLDKRQFDNGFGEVIKYAFIEENCLNKPSSFFDYLNSNNTCDIEEIIFRCCEMKASVVEEDEKEKGLRSFLNFGHTIGHAVEKITDYNEILHGEGVIYGMMCAINLARNLNFINDNYFNFANNFIKKYNPNLNLSFKNRADEIIAALKNDKKVKFDKLNFVMPKRLGYCQILQDIDELSIKESLL